MYDVPFVRRMLVADRRRLAAAIAGVGLALMLVLLLDGLWAGVQVQVTAYGKGVGAQLFVAQPGTRNLVGDVSVIPNNVLDQVRSEPNVDWADRIRSQFTILDLHDKKVAVSLIGFDPGHRGGPWSLAEGRSVQNDNEVVVDEAMSRRHGLHPGSEIEIMGRRFRVVGVAADTTSFMTGVVFLSHAATDDLLEAHDTTSFVLVRTRDPEIVQDRLTREGFSVLTPAQVAKNDIDLLTGVYGIPLQLMVMVAFAAGTLVIALSTYSSIAEHRREYGIIKAIGADGRRLLRVALGQTLGLATLGGAAGGLLSIGGRFLIMYWRPQFLVTYTTAGIMRMVLAALVMSILAGAVSARHLARIEPASAYRGA